MLREAQGRATSREGTMHTEAAIAYPRATWPARAGMEPSRTLAEEMPVALVHDGSTTAVMMATPADLEDFVVGFSLTEGVVDHLSDIREIEVVEQADGIEVRTWLRPGAGQQLAGRRRRLAGPTGCGLCGVESLQEAARSPGRVKAEMACRAADLLAAMAQMSERQTLGALTRAAHAAAFWTPEGVTALREDVGRHNALDKLVGALARKRAAPSGAILLTSRVSVEMVQKAAAFGAPILCAVSAPTALAVRTAEAAGVTLVAVCRADGFEVFTCPERIELS